MPVGLRGVGKTVLLNQFAEISKQEGLKVSAIEAPENGDFRILLAVAPRRVLLEFDQTGAAGAAKAAVLKALRVLNQDVEHRFRV
jgi:molybdopterin-guanine dinucleotide biosynthesis protein